jgi:hypothetical protein
MNALQQMFWRAAFALPVAALDTLEAIMAVYGTAKPETTAPEPELDVKPVEPPRRHLRLMPVEPPRRHLRLMPVEPLPAALAPTVNRAGRKVFRRPVEADDSL